MNHFLFTFVRLLGTRKSSFWSSLGMQSFVLRLYDCLMWCLWSERDWHTFEGIETLVPCLSISLQLFVTVTLLFLI